MKRNGKGWEWQCQRSVQVYSLCLGEKPDTGHATLSSRWARLCDSMNDPRFVQLKRNAMGTMRRLLTMRTLSRTFPA